VVVGKCLDGLPLYRKSAIFLHEGIEIERATLADWVGHAAWWVAPLAALIGCHVKAAPVRHTDDTPIACWRRITARPAPADYGPLWKQEVDTAASNVSPFAELAPALRPKAELGHYGGHQLRSDPRGMICAGTR
jgi:hypothetical protein